MTKYILVVNLFKNSSSSYVLDQDHLEVFQLYLNFPYSELSCGVEGSRDDLSKPTALTAHQNHVLEKG